MSAVQTLKLIFVAACCLTHTVSALPCRPAPYTTPKDCHWTDDGRDISTSCPRFRLKCDRPRDTRCYEIAPSPDSRECHERATDHPSGTYYHFDVYADECRRVPVRDCLGVTNRFASINECHGQCPSAATTYVRRPHENNHCNLVRCERCHTCRLNELKQPKCVLRENCNECAETPVNCVRDPCSDWQRWCPTAQHCTSSYCGGCHAYLYGRLYNRIDEGQCRQIDEGHEDPCHLLDCQPGYRCKAHAGIAVCERESTRPGSAVSRARLEKCSAPVETGPCFASLPRYYYDRVTAQCLTFTYGGCDGNKNNFNTERQCLSTCGDVEQCPTVRLVAAPPGCRYDVSQSPVSLCPVHTLNCLPDTSLPILPRIPPARRSKCSLPPEHGRCLRSVTRWYYDTATARCTTFVWGGCGKRGNNFRTRRACRRSCAGGQDEPGAGEERRTLRQCSLDAERGPCEALVHRWRYDRLRGECSQFEYGGCRGNENNFVTRRQCQRQCGHVERCPIASVAVPHAGCHVVFTPSPINFCPIPNIICKPTVTPPIVVHPRVTARCSLPAEVGTCRGAFPRLHYDRASGQCRHFIYGGCGGNENNFEDETECLAVCGAIEPCPEPHLTASSADCHLVVTGQDAKSCPIYSERCANDGYADVCRREKPCGYCQTCVPDPHANRRGYYCRDEPRCGGVRSCAELRCAAGEQCRLVGGRATCTPTPPDTCPAPRPGHVGVCVELCVPGVPGTCERGLRCCHNGCGHVCMRPGG